MNTEQQNNDINSEKEVLKRLLAAFSLSDLKNVFSLNNNNSLKRKENIIEHIVTVFRPEQIKDFTFLNFSLLKQHVYTYECRGPIPRVYFNDHPSFYNYSNINNAFQWNLLYPVSFDVFDFVMNSKVTIDYLLPIKIVVKNRKIRIHYNILERDIKSLFQNQVSNVIGNISESRIIQSLVDFSVSKQVSISSLDVNKGIKFFLENDKIDVSSTNFKKSKSSSSERLDEDNLLKRDMLEEYEKLMESPIRKSTFKSIHEDVVLEYFTCDPSVGVFYFSVYPKLINETDNLIDLIISKN